VQALGVNASLVIERCPTALKRGVDVWGDPGAAVGVMRALKAKLDPNGTLNPGRYVGGI
jgi:glycolate oxidase FAD binding subunit